MWQPHRQVGQNYGVYTEAHHPDIEPKPVENIPETTRYAGKRAGVERTLPDGPSNHTQTTVVFSSCMDTWYKAAGKNYPRYAPRKLSTTSVHQLHSQGPRSALTAVVNLHWVPPAYALTAQSTTVAFARQRHQKHPIQRIQAHGWFSPIDTLVLHQHSDEVRPVHHRRAYHHPEKGVQLVGDPVRQL